ncbi:hypothetical protein, partial [Metallibacterium scheffleri]|uniref:hypothetical protein n=1 Tax=Metallibacterium scheffleri TaxID=993689 RepID=UPI0023F17D65
GIGSAQCVQARQGVTAPVQLCIGIDRFGVVPVVGRGVESGQVGVGDVAEQTRQPGRDIVAAQYRRRRIDPSRCTRIAAQRAPIGCHACDHFCIIGGLTAHCVGTPSLLDGSHRMLNPALRQAQARRFCRIAEFLYNRKRRRDQRMTSRSVIVGAVSMLHRCGRQAVTSP